jgi:hypothetical protein
MLALLLLFATGSCTRAHEPEPGAAPAPAPAPSAEPDDLPPVGFGDATIIFTDCGKVSNMNAKLAQKTMRRLVEACNEVPGGTAQFTATLLPDGHIELATSADGGLGTVPVCVLHHELKHNVVVSKPCTMQVQMTEKKPQ